MTFLRRYHKDESGIAAIEGALLFPLLAALGFGIVDSSMLMMQNHKLTAGLTSAGNYLSKTTNPQAVETKAKQLAVSGKFMSGAKPFIDNLQPSNVLISYRNIANQEINGTRDYRGGDNISVVAFTVSVPYEGIGFLKSMTAGNLKVSAKYETRLIGSSA